MKIDSFPSCYRCFIDCLVVFIRFFERFFGSLEADNVGIIIFLFIVLNNIGFSKVSKNLLLFVLFEPPVFAFD